MTAQSRLRWLSSIPVMIVLGMTAVSASIPAQAAFVGGAAIVDRFLAPERQPLGVKTG